MKKYAVYIISALVIVGVIIYFIVSGQSSGSVAVANQNPSSSPSADNSQNATTSAGSPPDNSGSGTGQASGSSSGQTPTGQYKDGTYTGSVANAIYGQLQATVTISGGKITDVTFPVYPNNPGHTSDVSASTLPQLKQEAIASQSANVAIVSGATQDSEAFQQTLASALAQASS